MELLTPALGIPTALAVRAGTIALTLAARRHPRRARLVAFWGSTLGSLIVLLTAIAVLRGSAPPAGILWTHTASGVSFSYAVDGLSAWFLVVLSVLAIPVAIYSIGYAGHGPLAARSVFFGAAFNVLLVAVEGVFVADDALAFVFVWELMTLVTAALVATEHESRAARRATFLYLVMSHVGTGFLIAAFLILGAHADDLSFRSILSGQVLGGPTRSAVFALFLLGFGVKSGVIPVHVWLPEAHPAAPSSISAFMSGVLIKTGIYGIVRFCMFGLGVPSLTWGIVVLALGATSALLGVLYALMQHDLKRLLAYHSIENIGIILLGLGAGMMAMSAQRPELAAIGIIAGLFHVLNHATFKGLLFLGAGGVAMATGTRQVEHLGGLLRRMPWTGGCFLVGALAISGFPPLNGFASEWLTFQALLHAFDGLSTPLSHFVFPVAGAVLALTTALAAACFVKAFGITFLALPRSAEAAHAIECPRIMIVPQVGLAALCVGLGLLPGVVVASLAGVVSPLLGLPAPARMTPGAMAIAPGTGSFDHVTPVATGLVLLLALGFARWLTTRRARVVRTVATWGCGGILDAQTEYTATAFSKPLMMIFAAIYRPTREVEARDRGSVYFPHAVHYRARIEPTFERYLYEPLARAVLQLADRLKVLQAGSLHAYLAYVILLVLVLVLFVWWSA